MTRFALSTVFLPVSAELLGSSPPSPFFKMESIILTVPNAIVASTVIAVLYLVFHLVSQPRSYLDKLPALGKPSDPYLQKLLVEGSKIVRSSSTLSI